MKLRKFESLIFLIKGYNIFLRLFIVFSGFYSVTFRIEKELIRKMIDFWFLSISHSLRASTLAGEGGAEDDDRAAQPP